MLRQIFPVFIFLLFVWLQFCGQTCSAHQVQASVNDNGNLFDEFLKIDWGEIKFEVNAEGGEEVIQHTVKSIDIVNLVAVDGMMVALAQVVQKGGDDQINLLAKFYKIEETNDWGINAVTNEKNSWKVQLAAENLEKADGGTVMKSSVVVSKEEKTIYYFTFSNKINNLPGSAAVNTVKWKIKLFKGKIATGSKTNEIIRWESLSIFVLLENSLLKEKLNTQQAGISVCNFFAFLSGNKKYIAFVIEVTETVGSSAKYIIAVFELEENASQKKLKFFAERSVDCLPSVFWWNEKLIMMSLDKPKSCSKKVIEFDVSKKSFTESDNSVARLWNFLKDKNNFVTATIGEGNNNNVLLFTQQKVNGDKSNAHLWMTDGTRVGYAGIIVKDFKETFCGFLLHTKTEMFALHQKYNIGNKGEKVVNTFSLARLKTELDEIKFLLDEWKKNNEKIEALCNNIKEPNISCNKPPPIAGVVGFLHMTINDSTKTNTIIWKDEYYYSNVTTNNGEATKLENLPNGLKFSGAGKGVKWSMEKKQNEILYNFTDPGFTLLATVTIENSTNNNQNSVLGVSFKDNTKTNSVGLWCTTDGKWGVSYGDDSTLKTKGGKCKQENTYNVALVLETQNLDVYVNGEKLTNEIKTIAPSKSIEHFYFGANNNQEVERYVTVTNVLLYNRPFNGSEIDNLKKYIKSVEVVTPLDGNTQKQPKNDTGSGSDPQTPPTLLPPSSEEKAPSPSRTEDGGVGGGVRVFSLLLPLLCVSAPLLHL